MKNYLYCPPAFKSDFQNEPPKSENKDDLYLKGLNYNTGKEVNFDEVYEAGIGSDSGMNTKHSWQLIIFKNTGTTQVQTVHSGLDWGDFGEEAVNCDNGWFNVETPNYTDVGKWEKAIASVKFKLGNHKK